MIDKEPWFGSQRWIAIEEGRQDREDEETGEEERKKEGKEEVSRFASLIWLVKFDIIIWLEKVDYFDCISVGWEREREKEGREVIMFWGLRVDLCSTKCGREITAARLIGRVAWLANIRTDGLTSGQIVATSAKSIVRVVTTVLVRVGALIAFHDAKGDQQQADDPDHDFQVKRPILVDPKTVEWRTREIPIGADLIFTHRNKNEHETD
jgi:hypothetical protein